MGPSVSNTGLVWRKCLRGKPGKGQQRWSAGSSRKAGHPEWEARCLGEVSQVRGGAPETLGTGTKSRDTGSKGLVSKCVLYERLFRKGV